MSSPRASSDDRAGWYRHAMQLYSRGQYEQVLTELQALRERNDPLGSMAKYYCALAHRALGLGNLAQGRFEQAEKHLLAAMAEIGRHAELCCYLARIYANTRRYDRCAVKMGLAAEDPTQSVSTWRKLAQAQWQSGRRAEAHMTLTAAMRKFGDEAELHLQKGLFDAAEDRPEEARTSFALAAEADRGRADAYYYLGLAESALGNLPAAVEALQRALSLRPDDLLLTYQLALAARALKAGGKEVVIRPPESQATDGGLHARPLARYVAADPDVVAALLSLPESEADEELFGSLLAAVEAAVAQRPDYADLHFLCSRILARLHRAPTAVEHANRALEINPRYVQALLHLAELYADLDRPAEALEHLQRAVACGADWPDVHCRIAELMIRCNPLSDARQHLRRALQLKPSLQRAADVLAALAA